jgi:hypothetical protein
VSSQEPVDAVAFENLERLVRALGEELARFRKRALQAETRLKQLESAGTRGGAGGAGDLFTSDRVASLESENRELRERLDAAALRTRTMLDRVRFLRQQTDNGSGA